MRSVPPAGGSPPETKATGRRDWLLLGLILVAGALLRLYGIGQFASPDHFWDERFVVAPAGSIALHGNWRPDGYYWPSLPTYWGGLFAIGAKHVSALWELVTGHPLFELSGPQRMMPDLFLISRFAMVVLSVSTIWLAFRIARSLYGSDAALVAAAICAGSFYLVHKSKDATPDTLLTLSALVSLQLTLRAAESPSWGRFLAAGLGVGLAVASKYNGVALAAPLLLVALVRLPVSQALNRLAVAGLASVAFFFLTNPYATIDWELFRQHIGITRATYERKGADRMASHWGMLPFFWAVLSQLLVGLVPAVLGVYGVLSAFLRRQLNETVLAAFAIFYVSWFSYTTKNPIAHNFLVVTPVFAILAAGVAWRGLRRASALLGLGGRAERLLAAAWASALVLPGFLGTSVEQLRTRSPKCDQVAAHWARALLPDRARVFAEEVSFGWRARSLQLTSGHSALIPRRSWLLAQHEYLLLNIGQAARTLGGAPAALRQYRELVLDPRLALIDVHAPPARFQRDAGFALLRVAELGGWVQVLEHRLSPREFQVFGDGGADHELVWLRGPGSVARASVPFSVGPGEALSVELLVGADDSMLVGQDGAIDIELGIDGNGRTGPVECNQLGALGSGIVPVSAAGSTIELAYHGAPGGRIYMTEIRVRRHAPLASLPVSLVERRARKLQRVQRAGL